MKYVYGNDNEEEGLESEASTDILLLGSRIKVASHFMRKSKPVYDEFYPHCPVRAQLNGVGPFREAIILSIDEKRGLCNIGHKRAALTESWKLPDTNFVASWSANSDILSVHYMERGTITIGQLIGGDNILPGTRIDDFLSGDGEKGTYRLSISQEIEGESVEVTAGLTALTITTITTGALEEGQLLLGTGLEENTMIF